MAALSDRKIRAIKRSSFSPVPKPFTRSAAKDAGISASIDMIGLGGVKKERHARASKESVLKRDIPYVCVCS